MLLCNRYHEKDIKPILNKTKSKIKFNLSANQIEKTRRMNGNS